MVVGKAGGAFLRWNIDDNEGDGLLQQAIDNGVRIRPPQADDANHANPFTSPLGWVVG